MPTDESLSAWIEMIDASVIFDAASVGEILCDLCKDDVNWDCDGVVWNEDGTIPIAMEVMYWNDSPPELELILEPLIPYLNPDEYLLFSCKRRYGVREHDLSITIVTSSGVVTADSSCMLHSLARFLKVDDEEDAKESADMNEGDLVI